MAILFIFLTNLNKIEFKQYRGLPLIKLKTTMLSKNNNRVKTQVHARGPTNICRSLRQC